MEIPRDARGADLIKNRYVAPQPLAPACSDGYSRIGLVEKAHLHVRFIVSKSETQKRPQRASQTPSCGRDDVRGRDGGALSTILTQNRYALYLPLRAAPSAMHRQIGRTEKAHLDRCAVCRQHARNAETAATRLKSALRRHHAEIIVSR